MSPPIGPQVFKFGGTSLATANRIRAVAELVAAETTPPVVVVSAMAGVTNRLEEVAAPEATGRAAALDEIEQEHLDVLAELAAGDEEAAGAVRQVLDGLRSPGAAAEAPLQERDRLLAAGEDLSSLLVAAAIRARGRPAVRVDARSVIRTDARFGEARAGEAAVRRQAAEHMGGALADGQVVVTQGFVGATSDGRTTTLGRGGSDLSAVLLGAALYAPVVHIWTDVDGILTGDPKYVNSPRVLDVVGFEEAVELAYFGAKVIHPGAAKQAVARGVPVRIRSTFAPDRPGTLILADRFGGPEIAAVAHKPGVALIKVRSRPTSLPYGFLARVFEVLSHNELAVDLVATSHTSTAFTVDEREEVQAVAHELSEVAEVTVDRGLATVTVVGNGLLRAPGFEARVFQAVGTSPVHLISQASDVSLSFVVDTDEAVGLVSKLHRELVEGPVQLDKASGEA